MARRSAIYLLSASVLSLTAGALSAQNVVSAKSGLVHYVEGAVLLEDKPVTVQYSQFPEVREGQVLKTEEGRAEVLLNPGVFLRLAESSSFRMLSNKLTDTRIEPLTGTMMLEVGETEKDNSLSLVYKDQTISFSKAGLFRLDAQTGAFRVYQGEAKVTRAGQTLVAKQAREVMLVAPVLTAMKFDTKEDDEFYRWASRRASYLALANVSAAKTMRDVGYSSMRNGMYSYGMWGFNPYFGMFTYIPYNAMYFSPFGYSFFSPYLVGAFYNSYPGYYSYSPGYYSGGGGAAASAIASRGAVNYAAPSRPSTISGSSAAGGFSRAPAAGGFGGMHRGFSDIGSVGSYSPGYSGSSAGPAAAVSSAPAASSGGASSGGGGSHGGAAGGHGR